MLLYPVCLQRLSRSDCRPTPRSRPPRSSRPCLPSCSVNASRQSVVHVLRVFALAILPIGDGLEDILTHPVQCFRLPFRADVSLALGLWKCNQMGILPTGSADFLAFETRGPVRSIMFQARLDGFHVSPLRLTCLSTARRALLRQAPETSYFSSLGSRR
jgi:hypothetical protein